MAVWMLINGRVPRKPAEEEALAILRSTPLDLSFLLVPATEGPLSPSRVWRADDALYQPSRWLVRDWGDESLDLHYPFDGDDHPLDGIRVSLWADIVSFSGPMDHFGVWAELVEPGSRAIRRGWQDVVEAIFRAFGAPEAVWYSEWTPFDSENLASFDDVAAFMASHPQLRSAELENLDVGQYFVQPIATGTST